MKGRKARAVLAGCGGMSRYWLSAARANNVDVVGLVDLETGAAMQRKDEFGLARAETGSDLRAMLKLTRPDVVFDCTVPAAHYSIVTTALKAGCHVLGEKPMAETFDQARRMVAAAARAGKIYAVTQNYRYDNGARAFRKAIASGRIGSITTVNCDFFLAPRFKGFRKGMDHVLLLDMAIHTFDSIRFLSGADPVSVYCREWNPKESWYRDGASAVAVFDMTRGIVATYRGSWWAQGLNTSWNCSWRVIGTEGSATWDGEKEIVIAAATPTGMKQRAIETKASDWVQPHVTLMKEFLHAARTGTQPETACTDNIRSIGMVFSAVRSAKLGRPVRVKTG